MDLLAPVKAFDRFQRRHAVLAIPIAVLKKFSDDQAGSKAALMAYYGFFSIFPLLLLFTTILGIVLHGDPGAQRAVLNSALKQFPIIGTDIKAHTLSGNGLGLAIGLVGSLLSGLAITNASQNAFNTVYAVPFKHRPNFLVSRLRGIKLLIVFGGLQLISTVASGLVTGGFGGVPLKIAGLALSLVLNLALFFAVFRLLTDNAISTRELVPGIVLAAVLWELLQAVGGIYIGHVVKGDSGTYGTFATVIGLLVWLYLGARVVVYSAEINTVLTRGLWPRSIMDPPTPADRRVRAALAKVEERDDKQTVDVVFHPNAKEPLDPAHPPYSVAPEPAPGEHAAAAPIPENAVEETPQEDRDEAGTRDADGARGDGADGAPGDVADGAPGDVAAGASRDVAAGDQAAKQAPSS